MGLVLHLNKLESPSPKDALCQVWLQMAHWFWRRRFFNFVNVFSLLCNYLPLEKGRALHLNKFESPSSKDALCKVWLKLAQWVWRRRFLYFVNVFSPFCNYISPLEKEQGPSFEQTWIPFTQGCFVPSLVEIGSVVLERKFFKICQCIFAISQLSPLGKGQGPSFEQTWIPFTQGYFVPSLVKIGPVVLEKKIFKFRQCIFTIL